jgi:hypothetical protein
MSQPLDRSAECVRSRSPMSVPFPVPNFDVGLGGSAPCGLSWCKACVVQPLLRRAPGRRHPKTRGRRARRDHRRRNIAVVAGAACSTPSGCNSLDGAGRGCGGPWVFSTLPSRAGLPGLTCNFTVSSDPENPVWRRGALRTPHRVATRDGPQVPSRPGFSYGLMGLSPRVVFLRGTEMVRHRD